MAFCSTCGAETDKAAFCSRCGAPVGGAAPVQAAPVNVNLNFNGAVKGPPCPKCGSQSTELAGVKNKKISAGKIAAGLMTGGLSCLATGVSSKQKVSWVCNVCKTTYTVKS